MSYKYEQSIPFKYKQYTKLKVVTFTDEIRTQLDYYYQYIDSLCEEDYLSDKGKQDKHLSLIADLSDKYKELRDRYIKPVVEKQYKYKGLLYTQEEVEFIFICSYALIDKFGLSQAELAKIFGLNKNKFSKLGCFPVRCHDAYTMLDDVHRRKSLVPDDSNSRGIQIAECINKKVQAVYACSAFVGVSNDLDVFTNISSTDKKAYVLTRPSSDKNFMRSLLSYPRFLFASANNFENIVGNYKAGDVKRKIINLLMLKDSKEDKKNKEYESVLIHSKYLRELLQFGDEYKKYCRDSQSTIFKRDLAKYRGQLELMSIIDADDYYSDDIIYDTEYRKTVGISADEINFDLEDEDALYDYLDESSQKVCVSLLKSFSYAGVSSFDEVLFEDYIYCMQMILVKNSKLLLQNESNSVCLLTEEEKIRLAAIYWILEVCGSEPMTEQKRDIILKYLKSKKLLSYFDAVNKEVKKGKELHLFYESEEFDINSILSGIVGIEDTSSPPVLLYIDSDSYKLEMGYADSLVKEKNVVLVVRATEGFTDEWGMELLDKQLSLYIKERQYASI